eukprot:NODE_532_length_1316_cov_213.509866_g384_i0.p2 GENE.NODE_532_length_1316_cov_213.509866_g384_i0~~NODE_532_length_1316_cov_213.509866_g384_i0.p2  ORF type:complete len:334 (-),score=95.95 NODE_532_length_1316_cov_213.509866_g384_i0:230-1231(-)
MPTDVEVELQADPTQSVTYAILEEAAETSSTASCCFCMLRLKRCLGIVDLSEIWFFLSVMYFLVCFGVSFIPFVGIEWAKYGHLIAAATSLFALFRIRLLGRLRELLDKFEAENNKLASSNALYQENNLQLKRHVDNMATENDELEAQIKQLNATVTDLNGVKDVLTQFAAENNQNLATALASLNNTLADQRKVLADQEDVLKKTRQAQRSQERLMLQQLQGQVQFFDQQAGISPDEYEVFMGLVPQVYATRLRATSTFATWDKNKDRSIDVSEFNDILIRLLDRSDVKTEAAGGRVIKTTEDMSLSPLPPGGDPTIVTRTFHKFMLPPKKTN